LEAERAALEDEKATNVDLRDKLQAMSDELQGAKQKITLLGVDLAKAVDQKNVALGEKHAGHLSLKQAEKDLLAQTISYNMLQANHSVLLRAHADVASAALLEQQRRTATASTFNVRR
jgi:hypothetical protein